MYIDYFFKNKCGRVGVIRPDYAAGMRGIWGRGRIKLH